MLLKENMEKSGDFLFRWRGYLPLVFLVAVFVTMYFDEKLLPFRETDDLSWPLICILVGCIGIVVRIFAVSFVPYGNSGRGTDRPYASSLNTTGLYSVMRNPVYFGNFFTFLAPVMYAQNIFLVLLYVPVFALYHERIILAEEKFLLGKFGQEYKEWADGTPAFFPDFSKWRSADRRFCWKTAYRRESISLFTLIATIWSLEVAYDCMYYNKFFIDVDFSLLLAVSALFFITNCVLVRYTRLLDVNR